MDYIEILLVEDNLNDAELCLRALKKNNLSNPVFHVKDGAEALDFLFAKGSYTYRSEAVLPKLILLDLKMPKIDGLEVLRIIKTDNETKHIPVVILTSSKEERDVIDSYNLGANSYIIKPVEFDKFSKSIVDIGMYWMLLNQNIIK